MKTAILKYTEYNENGSLPPYDGEWGTVTLQKWYPKEVIESHNWFAYASYWNHSSIGAIQGGGMSSNHGYRIHPPEPLTNQADPLISVKVEYNTVGKGSSLSNTEGWAAIEVTLIGIPIGVVA